MQRPNTVTSTFNISPVINHIIGARQSGFSGGLGIQYGFGLRDAYVITSK
jgi:hypothetical protein